MSSRAFGELATKIPRCLFLSGLSDCGLFFYEIFIDIFYLRSFRSSIFGLDA